MAASEILNKWNDGCGLLTGHDAERSALEQEIDAAILAEREAIELMVLRLRDKHDKMDPDRILLDTVADMIRSRTTEARNEQ